MTVTVIDWPTGEFGWTNEAAGGWLVARDPYDRGESVFSKRTAPQRNNAEIEKCHGSTKDFSTGITCRLGTKRAKTLLVVPGNQARPFPANLMGSPFSPPLQKAEAAAASGDSYDRWNFSPGQLCA